MPVEVECDFCGDTVSRPPSVVDYADDHFCDSDYCGTGFKRYERSLKNDQTNIESSDRHFCSRECKWDWQQETATYDWESTPNDGSLWKDRREQVLERNNRTCQGCGRSENL